MQLHDLALNLGVRVSELKSWPNSEVMDWVEYFRRRPAGWREDHRTHYLLSAQGVKAKPHEIFSSLHAIEKDKEEITNASVEGDASKLVASGFFNKILEQTNWDVKVDL
jgi:hypothetical protein